MCIRDRSTTGCATSSTRRVRTSGCTSTTRSVTATSPGTNSSGRCVMPPSMASPQSASSAGTSAPTRSTAACSSACSESFSATTSPEAPGQPRLSRQPRCTPSASGRAHDRLVRTENRVSTQAARRAIGVGLISVGWMGRLHTRAYKSVAERYPELGLRARLVIAADTVEASAREAAELLGYENWTLDYHEEMNHPDVDVVSICAPNFLHKEMALAAAEAAGQPSCFLCLSRQRSRSFRSTSAGWFSRSWDGDGCSSSFSLSRLALSCSASCACPTLARQYRRTLTSSR